MQMTVVVQFETVALHYMHDNFMPDSSDVARDASDGSGRDRLRLGFGRDY
jgi:hypothetical protein